MKHILNNLSEEEKNAIREQHAGGMKVMTENFSKLIKAKLGDSKPLVSEQTIAGNILSGSSQKAVKQVFDSCRNAAQSPNNTNKIVDGIYRAIQGMGTDEASIIAALTATRDFNTFCSAAKNYKTTYGTDLYSDLDGDIDEETLWAQISRVLRNLKPMVDTRPSTTRPGQGPNMSNTQTPPSTTRPGQGPNMSNTQTPPSTTRPGQGPNPVRQAAR
jgi:hypothetical protein